MKAQKCPAGADGPYAAVVGGVNIDIGGRAFAPLVTADSNPGAIRLSLGGVGRNIAHNLALLGTKVRLLTAYGGDLYGRRVEESCRELGIDISRALCVPGEATSTYLYIAGPDGEMALAMVDAAISARVTPAYLSEHLPLLCAAGAVAADANLSGEALRFLAERCTAPLFCDPVSTAKAERLRPILDRIHTLKPNRLEAALLAGCPVGCRADAERAASILLERGVGRVFLTMGPEGVYAAQPGEGIWLPNLPCAPVNTTGCGDAFMAALVWAHMAGLGLRDAALAGLAASAIAMESEQTINPKMSLEALRQRVGSGHGPLSPEGGEKEDIHAPK